MAAAVVGAAMLAAPGVARSQPKVSRTVDALFDEAAVLEQAGKVDAAIDRLKRAFELEQRPSIGSDLAGLYARKGKLLAAQNVLRVVASSNATSAADKRIVQNATRELDQLAARVPLVKITVQGDAAGKAMIIAGSRRLPADTWLELDPGRHLIEVRAPGFAPRFVTHEATAGQRQAVGVELTPQAATPIAGGAAAPLGAPAEEDEGGSAARPLMLSFGWTAISLSVVNLSIGSLAGLAVLAAKSDLDDQCVEDSARFGDDEKHCPTFSSLEHATAEASAGVATFGFVFGTLLLGGGITLVVLAPSGDDDEGPPPVNMQVKATPTGMMLHGTF
jgi:hypothetical protein